MTFLPCPGGCGRKVAVQEKWQTSNEAGGPLHCDSCIDLAKAEVEQTGDGNSRTLRKFAAALGVEVGDLFVKNGRRKRKAS